MTMISVHKSNDVLKNTNTALFKFFALYVKVPNFVRNLSYETKEILKIAFRFYTLLEEQTILLKTELIIICMVNS